MKERRPPFRIIANNRGFTMVEVVLVLIVLAILTAIAASRYMTKGTSDLIIEADGLKASLRFAQIQALNDDTATWGIYFSGDGTSYVLYKNGSPAVDGSSNPVMIPVKIPDVLKDPPPNNTHKLQGNVKVTLGAGTTVTFKKWGKPDAAANITLTRQGENPITIAITAETGFVYVP